MKKAMLPLMAIFLFFCLPSSSVDAKIQKHKKIFIQYEGNCTGWDVILDANGHTIVGVEISDGSSTIYYVDSFGPGNPYNPSTGTMDLVSYPITFHDSNNTYYGIALDGVCVAIN